MALIWRAVGVEVGEQSGMQPTGNSLRRHELAGARIELPSGHMWWIPVLDDPALKGSCQAEGIYGQFIHLNPRKRLVVVVLSACAKPGYRRRLKINDDALFAALASSF